MDFLLEGYASFLEPPAPNKFPFLPLRLWLTGVGRSGREALMKRVEEAGGVRHDIMSVVLFPISFFASPPL